MACYRNGGCGPYENRSCRECPASKEEYLTKGKKKENKEIDKELIEEIMNTIDNHYVGYGIRNMKSDILNNINKYYKQQNESPQLYQVIVDYNKGDKEYEMLNAIYTHGKIKSVSEYIANEINEGKCSGGVTSYSNARVEPE